MKHKEAPDWFGCGRKITTESWNGFTKAARQYWRNKDARRIEQITHLQNQRLLTELKG